MSRKGIFILIMHRKKCRTKFVWLPRVKERSDRRKYRRDVQYRLPVIVDLPIIALTKKGAVNHLGVPAKSY